MTSMLVGTEVCQLSSPWLLSLAGHILQHLPDAAEEPQNLHVQSLPAISCPSQPATVWHNRT